MFRSTEAFALTRRRFRDFRPLPYPHPCASPLLCALGHALARRARVRRRSTQARQPSACRLPAPPRPIPTHLFHVKHVRTIPAHNQERESDMRQGCPLLRRGLRRARSARPPAPPAPFAAHAHGACRAAIRRPPTSYSLVSRETREHRPLPRSRALAPGLSTSPVGRPEPRFALQTRM